MIKSVSSNLSVMTMGNDLLEERSVQKMPLKEEKSQNQPTDADIGK